MKMKSYTSVVRDSLGDLTESSQALQQKEAITKQMIDIIASRLISLQVMANNRKYGLECDLRVNSKYCTKMVPPLDDPFELQIHTTNKPKITSPGYSTTNQAMYDRLFGSDDTNKLRSTPSMKKTKVDAQKFDERRSTRSQLEKKLQSTIDGHITRTVDSVLHMVNTNATKLNPNDHGGSRRKTYLINSLDVKNRERRNEIGMRIEENNFNDGIIEDGQSCSMNSQTSSNSCSTYNNGSSNAHTSGINNIPNINIHSKLLLLYTNERIRIQTAKKIFKQYLLSDISCKILEELFWLVFYHFFKKDSLQQQQELAILVSTDFVKLMNPTGKKNSVTANHMDYVFRTYPFAVSSAVIWGFHYLFPGSRHLYTFEFKNEMYSFICRLLIGLELCSISIQTMRRQIFPDEVLQDDGTGKQMSKQTSTNAAISQNESKQSEITPTVTPASSYGDLYKSLTVTQSESMLPKLTTTKKIGGTIQESRSTSNDVMRTADSCLESVLQCPATATGYLAPLPKADIQRKLLRSGFNAGQLSPLVREFVEKKFQPATGACILKRTIPTSKSTVGGVETYSKHVQHHKLKYFFGQAQRASRQCVKDIYQDTLVTKHELQMLQETQDTVLRSGKRGIQLYCTEIIGKNLVATSNHEDMQNQILPANKS